jgi:hypothetical protein
MKKSLQFRSVWKGILWGGGISFITCMVFLACGVLFTTIFILAFPGNPEASSIANEENGLALLLISTGGGVIWIILLVVLMLSGLLNGTITAIYAENTQVEENKYAIIYGIISLLVFSIITIIISILINLPSSFLLCCAPILIYGIYMAVSSKIVIRKIRKLLNASNG